MKNQNLLLILFLFLSSICLAQKDTSYYTSDDMNCKKEEATYYLVITPQPENYLVKEVYISTQKIKMLALCTEISILKKNGKCTYYFENGQKESEGNYVDNKKDGIWINWDKEGKDSSIIECFHYDNTYKNIRISAQEEPTPNDQLDTFYKLEEIPEFPGGQSEMLKFIAETIVYPKAAIETGITGTCYVGFIVEKDGSVTNPNILRGIEKGADCDAEAIRMVKAMPKWTPGKKQGRTIRVTFTLPIKFTLEDGRKKKKRNKK